MGTIAEKLSYLNDTKDLFKDRLNSLGAEITSSTTFRNYLTWLDTFYGEVSDKTDLSENGVVGRTSQETTTGKNLLNTNNIVTGTRNGLTTSYDSKTQEITINGTCNANNTQIIVSTDTIPFTSGTTKIVGYYVSGSITNNGLFRTFSASYQNYEGIDLTTLSSSNPTATKSSTFTGDKVRFDFRFDSGAVVTNFTIKLMVTDSNDTTFEKFTFGASPNPDCQQPINNLSGNVAYKVVGAQLYDYTDLKSSYDFLTYDEDGWYTATYDTSGENGKYLNFTTPVSNLLNTDTDYLLVTEIKSLEYTGTGSLNPVDRWGQFATSTSYRFETISNNTTYTAIKTTKSDFSNLSGCLTSNVYVGANSTVTIKFRLSIIKDTSVTPSNFNYEPYIEPQTFNIPLTEITLPNFISGYVDFDGQIITPSDTFITTNDYIEVKPNTQYTFKANTSGTRCLIGEYDINKEFIPQRKEIVIGNTYTTVNNAKYIKFSVPTDSTNIEIYETSKPPIELCKIDTYEDKIYSSNGRFYLNKSIGKELINVSDGQLEENGIRTRTTIPVPTSSYPELYCNYFLRASSYYDAVNQYNTTPNEIGINTNGLILCNIKNYTTVNEYVSFFANNNVYIYYPISTPTTTEITQENYPSLYNALKQIQDYLTSYKINKEFILGYSSPEIEY